MKNLKFRPEIDNDNNCIIILIAARIFSKALIVNDTFKISNRTEPFPDGIISSSDHNFPIWRVKRFKGNDGWRLPAGLGGSLVTT